MSSYKAKKGNDYIITGTVTNGGSAQDITGYSFVGRLVNKGTTILSVNGSISSAVNGIFLITFTDTQLNIDAEDYHIYVDMTDDSSNITTLDGGPFKLYEKWQDIGTVDNNNTISVDTAGASLSVALNITNVTGGGSVEGTAVLSTGEAGGVKFLREDGDGTCSWQTPSGSGDMLAATYDPQGISNDAFDTDNHTDGTTNKVYTATEKTKLAGIETSATADQTGAEIKTLYEAEADTNAFTDAEKTKLSGIETGADVTDTTNVTAAGALMDSEVTNLAQVKAFDSSDYATAAQGALADSASQPGHTHTASNITDLASATVTFTNKSGNISQWTNDSGYITGYTVTEGDVTAHEAALSIVATQIANGTVSDTEFQYLNGVTSAIQTQLDAKQASDSELSAIAGLTSAANKIPMFSGSGTATVIDLLDEDNMSSDSTTGVPTQQSIKAYVDNELSTQEEVISIAVSDETTALTTGTAKATFRMPYAMTLTDVRASVTTAPTGSTIIVDINDGGTTIMSTNKLSIDATEKTSTTAATAPGITDSALADDAEITIDIDQIGSTVAGAGLKITLIGTRT